MGVYVTAHAQLRYLERAAGWASEIEEIRSREGQDPSDVAVLAALSDEYGLNCHALRAAMLGGGVREAIGAGATTVTIDGVSFVCDGRIVATTLGQGMLSKQRERGLSRKKWRGAR